MSIKDMPHVTVEQVLELRKAAIELEKELNKYKAHMVIPEKDVQDLCFVELDLILTKKELATLKASLPKIKADAVRELIREEITVGRLRNDQKRSFIFVSDASKYANKLEAGE